MEMKNCVDTIDGQIKEPIVISGHQPAQRLNRKRREESQTTEDSTGTDEGFNDLKGTLEATKHDKARADLFSQSLEEYSHLIHTEIVSYCITTASI